MHRLSVLILVPVAPLLLLSTSFGQPAQLAVDHITANQGLSNSSVTAVAQDNEGFLWFGTEDGLNRYDGYSFQVYRHDGDDTLSLAHSRVQSLMVDQEGHLWVGTLRGLDRYDAKGDGFMHIDKISPANRWLAQTSVNVIAQGRRATLWIGTSDGLAFGESDGGSFRKFSSLQGNSALPPNTSVNAILEARDGILWIGTSKGLFLLDSSRSRLIPVPAVGSRQITALVTTTGQEAEDLWIGSTDGLFILDRRTMALRLGSVFLQDGSPFPRDMVNSLYVDSRGILWVGTIQSGLLALAPGSGRFMRYSNDLSNTQSLDRNRVNTIFEDRGGVIWISTYRGALNKYDTRKEAFYQFTMPRSVYAVLLDSRGDLWLGSDEEGLWRVPAGGQGKARRVSRFPMGKDEQVLAITEDASGTVWIGTNSGLSRYHRSSDSFSKTPIPRDVYVKTLLADDTHTLWVGTLGHGFARYDTRRDTFEWFRQKATDKQGLLSDQIWSIAKDASGMIWIGTFGGGLTMLNPTTGRFTQFPNDSVGSDGVYSVWIDNDQNVWIGTFGGGLTMLNRTTGSFLRHTEKGGLPDNFVKSVTGDAQGNVWMSTDKGIARLDPRTGVIRSYSSRDVLYGDVFLSGSSYRCPDGRLVFGGEEGTTIFHPDSIRFNATPPPISLTTFEVFNQPFPTAWSALQSGIAHLQHDQTSISLGYVAFDFAHPEGITYAYKLEGVDRDWVNAAQRRYVTYAHLQPGSYTFRVRATNDDGVTNLEGKSLLIVIAPPFWHTWWFILGMGAFVVTIAVVAFRLWLRQQLALERLRQRIANDLHDDVGTELSSIVLASQYLAKTLPLEHDDRLKIESLGSLARSTHEMMRDIVWVLRTDNDLLDELVVKMRELTSRLLANITYEFETPPLSTPLELRLEVKRNLFLFYKEALNNIVRHSGATTVRIQLTLSDRSLGLSIVDNGRGFDQTLAGSGSGMRTLRHRADSMGAALAIQSNPGGGTTISLSVRTT